MREKEWGFAYYAWRIDALVSGGNAESTESAIRDSLMGDTDPQAYRDAVRDYQEGRQLLRCYRVNVTSDRTTLPYKPNGGTVWDDEYPQAEACILAYAGQIAGVNAYRGVFFTKRGRSNG